MSLRGHINICLKEDVEYTKPYPGDTKENEFLKSQIREKDIFKFIKRFEMSETKKAEDKVKITIQAKQLNTSDSLILVDVKGGYTLKKLEEKLKQSLKEKKKVTIRYITSTRSMDMDFEVDKKTTLSRCDVREGDCIWYSV